MSSIVQISDLTVSYGKKVALDQVSFELNAGEIIGVIGPNGSGKSTLLKSIMGLVKSDAGRIRVYGEKLNTVRDRISYVPQRESVDWEFPVSVYDVVEMGRFKARRLLRPLSKADRQIVLNAIEEVQLSEYKNRQIGQLSGGQQQRVFLARAIAQQADLYLMDEPFAGVDAATEKALIDLMLEMKRQGKTIIIVHHDLSTVKEYFDSIVMLDTSLITCGKTDRAFTRENLIAAYGGSMKVMDEI